MPVALKWAWRQKLQGVCIFDMLLRPALEFATTANCLKLLLWLRAEYGGAKSIIYTACVIMAMGGKGNFGMASSRAKAFSCFTMHQKKSIRVDVELVSSAAGAVSCPVRSGADCR